MMSSVMPSASRSHLASPDRLEIGVLMFGIDTYIPLFVQGVRGGTATEAAVLLMSNRPRRVRISAPNHDGRG